MKTPEEIKKGLECCAKNSTLACQECPYRIDKREGKPCFDMLLADVKELHDILNQRLAQAERERDAMLLDMQRYSMCGACKHFVDGKKCPLYDDCDYAKVGRFEWRGMCAENTKDDAGV